VSGSSRKALAMFLMYCALLYDRPDDRKISISVENTSFGFGKALTE
jgi:hypothetical protein